MGCISSNNVSSIFDRFENSALPKYFDDFVTCNDAYKIIKPITLTVGIVEYDDPCSAFYKDTSHAGQKNSADEIKETFFRQHSKCKPRYM